MQNNHLSFLQSREIKRIPYIPTLLPVYEKTLLAALSGHFSMSERTIDMIFRRKRGTESRKGSRRADCGNGNAFESRKRFD